MDTFYPRQPFLASDQPLPRTTLLRLLNTALACGETRYARATALAWLGNFPGDLEVSLLQAKAFSAAGLYSQALPLVERQCQLDPEDLAAQQLLATVQRSLGLEQAQQTDACVLALGGAPHQRAAMPKWASLLRAAGSSQESREQGFSAKKIERNENLIHQALGENPQNPLAAVLHLRHLLKHLNLPAALQSVAQAYHSRWPDCLIFRLVLAHTLLEGGQAEQAVAYLHEAAAQDLGGQVVFRLWGEQHPYRAIWPENPAAPAGMLQSPQNIPIPATVAAALGWNQLPSGMLVPLAAPQPGIEAASATSLQEKAGSPAQAPKPIRRAISPEVFEAHTELEQAARRLQQPGPARLDGRYPVYVICSSRQHLEQHYGQESAQTIDQAMRKLSRAIEQRQDWNALVFYPDNPEQSSYACAQTLKPAQPNNPWEIKLALADLDAALVESGEMIGAILIVGGPEIVPFHRLPNPLDDDDLAVPSDNPYSTRDENYFIPEWPVGRLPGIGKSPELLLTCLGRYTIRHQAVAQSSQPRHWVKAWRQQIQKQLLRWRFWLHTENRPTSFGYSAAIWRRASLAVFRPIGEARLLRISPATDQAGEAVQATGRHMPSPSTPLAYYNLHGMLDAREWFGQRDPNEPGEGPDYPVALRPEDITGSAPSSKKSSASIQEKAAPLLVFSEACYGAHLPAGQAEAGIAQRFLQAGSLAVVGSTCTSYGSISVPLVAADLLGHAFWQFLKQGQPAGEALRRAKVHLVRQTHTRQGYLAGEDQKTLISFVYYGDPLAQASDLNHKHISKDAGRVFRSTTVPPAPRTVCDRTQCSRCQGSVQTQPAPAEVLLQVKKLVTDYLPGMAGAEIHYSTPRSSCQSNQDPACPSAQMGTKAAASNAPGRQVVVLSKSIEIAHHKHHQYARLTLDSQGKMLRLVVSR